MSRLAARHGAENQSIENRATVHDERSADARALSVTSSAIRNISTPIASPNTPIAIVSKIAVRPMLADLLVPEPDDVTILKPRHSAFYGTALEFLLDDSGITTLALTGIAADSCVLFSAWTPFSANTGSGCRGTASPRRPPIASELRCTR